jgi:5-methylthioadenosine/S-adenosylhomocysteine deaminase
MATKNAYSAYKINGGKIEKGRLADIILIDKKRFNLTPTYNPLYNIVYGSYGCEVTHSIIDGKIIMNDCVVELNEDKILSKADAIQSKFL